MLLARMPLSCSVLPPVPLKEGRSLLVADPGPVATLVASMPLSASVAPAVPLHEARSLFVDAPGPATPPPPPPPHPAPLSATPPAVPLSATQWPFVTLP